MSDVGWWKGLDCSAAQNSKIKVPGTYRGIMEAIRKRQYNDGVARGL